MSAKKRNSKKVSKWMVSYIDSVGKLNESRKERELLDPIVSAVFHKKLGYLEKKYKEYCSKVRHGKVMSSDDWIDSYIKQWKELLDKEVVMKRIINRLNGVNDKDAWNGNIKSLPEVQPC